MLGAFYLFAPITDLAADARVGLPSDHVSAFQSIAGVDWASARQSSPGITQYVTLLEIAYAAHELVIVAIPFRRGARWAWWSCWPVMLANLAYTLTFGGHDPTILKQSLVADVALPLLLLIQIPSFFGGRRREP